MYHPLLLPPEVLHELPALLNDLRAGTAPSVDSAGMSYRSEAFAEDLQAHEAQPAPPRRRARLLTAAPLCAALLGGLFIFVG